MHDFAILCPGQGSQTPTMFDLAAATPQGVAVIAAFSQAASIDLLTRTRANEALFDNAFAQPAMVASAVATWSSLAPALPPPAAFAGYSVGEVSAWACAGAWTVARAAEVVMQRAQAMDRFGPPGCGMLAVRGLSIDAIRRVAPTAAIAIVNGPDHVVLAATIDLLCDAASTLAAAGAWTRRLDVRIPSHSASMTLAADAFAATLDTRPAAAPSSPVLRGVDGCLLRQGDDAAPALARAIREPIRWDACMHTLAERGVRVALELGPGRSLTALAAEIRPALVIRSVDDFRTLDGVVAWLLNALET